MHHIHISNMKTTLLSLIGSLVLSFHLFSQTPRLEIHHIGAGDGDATLIIAIDKTGTNSFTNASILDTAIILIDGQRTGGGEEVWKYVQNQVNALSPKLKRIDYIVVSHLHSDHFEGITTLVNSARTSNWTIQAVIDGQNANYNDYLPADNMDCYGVYEPNDPESQAFQNYRNALAKSLLTPTYSVVPGVDILAPFHFEDLGMICVVANGQVLNAEGGFDNFLPKKTIDQTVYYNPKSPNDLSIGFLIEFQGFHYLTMGDLGGVTKGNYVNGETPVTNWLVNTFDSEDYHICALKVSHHGSKESSTKWFCETNNPTVSIIEAALRTYGKSQNPLPTQKAIENLQSTGTNNLFYTFVPLEPEQAASYWTKNYFNLYNDVVLKVIGLPGEGQNVTMEITQTRKNENFTPNGDPVQSTVICTKGHDWGN